MLETIVWIVHILVALGIIGLVLIQHGKGADMGAAFGSGASGSLFGATGSANFLSRTTAVLAAVFFVTSLTLTYLHSAYKPQGIAQHIEQSQKTAPEQKPQPPESEPVLPSKAGEIPN
jgi:preprotein translocase subunit SecG